MNLRIYIRKILRNYNDTGILRTIKKSYYYVFRNVHVQRCYRLYRINLQDAPPSPKINNKFEYKIVTVNDRNIIRQIEQMEEWLEGKLTKKLEREGICLVAMDGDRVSGFNIVSFGEVFIPFVNYKRRFKPFEAWSDQVTVNKDYRRNGLGASLRYKIYDELKKRGIKRFYGGTLLPNEANLQLCRKVGLKEIIDVNYVKFFNKERWYLKRIKNESH